MGPEIAINLGKPTSGFIKGDASVSSWEEHDAESGGDCPSDILVMCLNSIEESLQQNDDFITERSRPFYANPWGFEFWSYYVSGKDVLEMDGSGSKIEKIAWITATAADIISMKEDDGVSFNGPFLLYLVPSQDKIYEIAINLGKPTSGFIKGDASVSSWEEHDAESGGDCPSDILVMCLNSIEESLQQNDDFITERSRPFYANPWGFEFWSYYVSGKDVLEMDGSGSKIEKIAWITATAADIISTKEDDGVSFNGPFLLYLVPSQDKIYEVFQVCKPLIIAGIYAFTLHSDDSIDHQIHSLKSCEPEFLISTPERLLELLSSKAIDLSDVSLMVIDGLEAPLEDTYLDAVKSIRQFISGNPQIVVFGDCKNDSSISPCK